MKSTFLFLILMIFYYNLPGAYYIKATGKIYEDVGGYGEFVMHYRPAFYEHASREQDAVLIDVKSNIEGIDIELFDTDAVRISGKIIDNKDSKPIPMTEICLYSPHWQMLKKFLRDVNGYYEINELTSGETYYLKATGYYIDDQSQRVKNFAALWYPVKIDSSDARALTVLENLTGIYFYLNAVAVESINENLRAPETYIFKKNYPNPFNPITQIQSGLPEKGFVEILVYDIRRRLVKCLQPGEIPTGGIYSVGWYRLSREFIHIWYLSGNLKSQFTNIYPKNCFIKIRLHEKYLTINKNNQITLANLKKNLYILLEFHQ